MSTRVKYKIQPKILRYARTHSGYSFEDVEEKVKNYRTYEKEPSEITITDVEKLARKFKFPVAFFFLNEIPEDVVMPDNYRIIYKDEDHAFSPATFFAIRRARYVQEAVRQLTGQLITHNLPHASVDDDYAVLGKQFREQLGVRLEEQKKWNSHYDALNSWRALLGDIGIYVLQDSFPSNEMNAFCLVDSKPNIIVLNSSDSVYRRIFSLFHEVAHIMLNQSGLCTVNDNDENTYEYKQIEIFCNNFAAAFLLPQDELLEDTILRQIAENSESLDAENVETIAHKYKMSKDVFLLRLHAMGYISESKLKTMQAFWRKKDSNFKKKPGGPIRFNIKVVSRNGQKFSKLVIDNYRKNAINSETAARLLDINASHLNAIESRVS